MKSRRGKPPPRPQGLNQATSTDDLPSDLDATDLANIENHMQLRCKHLEQQAGTELAGLKGGMIRQMAEETSAVHARIAEKDVEIEQLSAELLALTSDQHQVTHELHTLMSDRGHTETKIVDAKLVLRTKIKIFYAWVGHSKTKRMKQRLTHIAAVFHKRKLKAKVICAWTCAHLGIVRKYRLHEMGRIQSEARVLERARYSGEHAALGSQIDGLEKVLADGHRRRETMQLQLYELLLRGVQAWRLDQQAGKEGISGHHGEAVAPPLAGHVRE